jgi:1-acyl-sn-glycerol-3-phosphate acyltransferase
MLPQWSLNSMRPVMGFVSKVFWKIRYKGVENIPQNGGLVIAANHQTYIDPFWLSIPIKRPLRYLAWNVAFDWPVIGKAMRLLGAWPLQLEGSDPAAIRRSLQWLKTGGAVVIFPEGGRGKPDGSMIRFKAGAIRIALEAGVPILPVTIKGANGVWPIGRRLPRTGEVELTFHPVYQVSQLANEEARSCARRESESLAKIIGSAL